MIPHRPTSGKRRAITEARERDAQLLSSDSPLNSAGILGKDSFADVKALQAWLLHHGVTTLKWGTGSAKTVAHLLGELQEGDTVLQVSPVLRVTHVLRGKIKRPGGNKFVLETHQQFDDGRIRQRNQLLAEKMHPGEDVCKAAIRGVKEELGEVLTDDVQITVLPETLEVTEETLESASYPTLTTKYVLHTIQVEVPGLPASNFFTREMSKDGGRVKQKHFWKWRTEAQVQEALTRRLRAMLGPLDDDNGGGGLGSTSPRLAQQLASAQGGGSVSSGDGDGGDGAPVLFDLVPDSVAKMAAMRGSGSGDAAAAAASAVLPEAFRDAMARVRAEALVRSLRRWGHSLESKEAVMAGLETVQHCGHAYLTPASLATALARVRAAVVQPRPNRKGDTPSFTEEEAAVLRALYPDSCRCEVQLLHGGFSGSRVLQVQSWSGSRGGVPEESSVVKLDGAAEVESERDAMMAIGPHLGENTCSVLALRCVGDRGGLKIQLAGACWCLPDLVGSTSGQTALNTFKDVYLADIREALSRDRSQGGAGEVKGDGGGDGGGTVFGDSLQTLNEVFGEILHTPTVSLATNEQPLNVYNYYELPRLLDKHVFNRQKLAAKFQRDVDSGKLGAVPLLPARIEELQPGVEEEFAAFRDSMAEYTGNPGEARYQGIVHGDLNGCNILIDSESIVWVIDFAFTATGHVLKDLAKLENTVLFEYTPLLSPQQLPMATALTDALAAVPDLKQPLTAAALGGVTPTGVFEVAWTFIVRLRHHVSTYCVDDYDPVQYSMALLTYALRTLSFRDISMLQKQWALASARKHMAAIRARVSGGQLTPFSSSSLPDDGATQLNLPDNWEVAVEGGKKQFKNRVTGEVREVAPVRLSDDEFAEHLRKYLHSLIIRNSFIVDPISRTQLNILQQCVSLKVLEGEDKQELMSRQEEIDRLVEKELARKRMNGVRGEREEAGGDAKRTSGVMEALKILLPDADLRQTRKVVILGAAASGKSCLLKRVLVMAADNYRGLPSDLVPVLILLIDLGRLMTKHGLGARHNLLEWYLRDTYGAHSGRYRMLMAAAEQGRLLLLLDGLDEAGDQKEAIEEYISHTMVHDEQRLLVSSRHSGFKDSVFESFKFIQVCPLSLEMQTEIARLRLGKRNPVLPRVLSELRKEEYAEMAQNPLMLSLLISIFRQIAASDAEQSAAADGGGSGGAEPSQQKQQQRGITRARLYDIGISLMLHRSANNKYAMRRGEHDRSVELSLRQLAHPLCLRLLEVLSFRTHARRVRDIRSEAMVEAMEQLEGELEEEGWGAEGGDDPSPVEVLNALNRNVRAGRVPLFVCLSENYRADTVLDMIVRFAHLTFQEFLAGKYVMRALQAAEAKGPIQFQTVVRELLTSPGSARPFDRLHEGWWLQVILFAGGMMSGKDVFFKFVQFILDSDDASGANTCMVKRMLMECPPDAPSTLQVAAQVTAAIQRLRPSAALALALQHPSREMRNLVLSEIKEFMIDPSEVAEAILLKLQAGSLRWYTQQSAIQSLGILEVASDAVVEYLMGLWMDAEQDEAIAAAAACAIGALQAQNHRVVVAAMMAQAAVDPTAAMQNILALRVTDPEIVQLVASMTFAGGDDDASLTSVIATRALCVLPVSCTLEELSPDSALLGTAVTSAILRLASGGGVSDARLAQAALDKLLEVVSQHPNCDARHTCLKSLLFTFGLLDGLVDALLQWFDDPKPDIRTAASTSVGSLPPPWNQLKVIGEAVRDKGANATAAAIQLQSWATKTDVAASLPIDGNKLPDPPKAKLPTGTPRSPRIKKHSILEKSAAASSSSGDRSAVETKSEGGDTEDAVVDTSFLDELAATSSAADVIESDQSGENGDSGEPVLSADLVSRVQQLAQQACTGSTEARRSAWAELRDDFPISRVTATMVMLTAGKTIRTAPRSVVAVTLRCLSTHSTRLQRYSPLPPELIEALLYLASEDALGGLRKLLVQLIAVFSMVSAELFAFLVSQITLSGEGKNATRARSVEAFSSWDEFGFLHEAGNPESLIQMLRNTELAPFVFQALLAYFRQQREEDPTGWALPAEQSSVIFDLVARQQLEAMFLAKELKIGRFEVQLQYFDGTDLKLGSAGSATVDHYAFATREERLTLARILETCERYEGMAVCITAYVSDVASHPLTIESRNLYSVANKNLAGTLRAAMRSVGASLRDADEQAGLLSLLRGYICGKLDAHVQGVCKNLEDHILPRLEDDSVEARVFFNKMIADQHRIRCEYLYGDNRSVVAEQSREYYTKAMAIAKEHLPPTHPTLLGVTLNYTVLLFETLQDKEQALSVGKDAFDEAISKLDTLSDSNYKDSTLIMQLIRDNLTLWTSEDPDPQQPEPWTAHDSLGAESLSLEDQLFLAQSLENAEMYEEMYAVTLLYASKGEKLEKKPRELFYVAAKNRIGHLRASWRSVTAHTKDNVGDSKLSSSVGGIIENEINAIVDSTVKVLLESLLPAAEGDAAETIYYSKMVADQFRFRCELGENPESSASANQYYSEALDLAARELNPTDPTRLGLALNYSVYLYEIAKDSDRATSLAKNAFDEAISRLDQLDEESYRDSTLIMQLLRDNLTLWTSQDDDDDD